MRLLQSKTIGLGNNIPASSSICGVNSPHVFLPQIHPQDYYVSTWDHYTELTPETYSSALSAHP